LYRYSEVPLKESLDLALYPALDSLVAFADTVVAGVGLPAAAVAAGAGAGEKKSSAAATPKRRKREVGAGAGAGVEEAAEALAERMRKRNAVNDDDVEAAETFEHALGAPRAVLMAALPALEGSLDDARLALSAHGPLLPTPLLLLAAADDDDEAMPPLAALVGATLCSAPGHYGGDRGQAVGGGDGIEAGVAAAMDVGAVREACRAAADRIPAAELPAAARALAFWCAFATADLNRHGGGGGEDEKNDEKNQASRRHTERGFVSLLGVCGAVLARARAVAPRAPLAAAAARRALLTSPALTAGFLNHGPLIAAAIADLVILDIEEENASSSGGGGGGSRGGGMCAPYIAAAAGAVEAELLVGAGRSSDSAATATALAVVPLVRHAAAALQRRVIEPAASGSGGGGDGGGSGGSGGGGSVGGAAVMSPAWRALAVEAAAAILSRLSSPLLSSSSSGGDGDDGVSVSAALSDAFSAALSLAASASDDTGTRASEVAAAALDAAVGGCTSRIQLNP
jgi:hypothetical protein